MSRPTLRVAACATLLWAGTATADLCNLARITAWKAYRSCIYTVVAADAKGVSFDETAVFARCRHAYFKKWTVFQSKASLANSTCIGSRYTDNGDQTVTDNLTGLTWEKKDNAGGIHDKDNTYSWSTGSPWYKENGTTFTTFLSTVNAGFGSANGWRLPTLAELQTIVLDFPCTGAFGGSRCTCPSTPCIDPALDAGNTSDIYWSAASPLGRPDLAWGVGFNNGIPTSPDKALNYHVRAVRGGL